jgi:hypothetical protein
LSATGARHCLYSSVTVSAILRLYAFKLHYAEYSISLPILCSSHRFNLFSPALSCLLQYVHEQNCDASSAYEPDLLSLC